MSKEVILTTQVEGLGIEGDVVNVADGYARNYLLPRKLAAKVSPSARRQLEAARQKRLQELAKDLEDARQLSEKLAAVSCTIAVKTHDGKMFGSVTATDIAKNLEGQGIQIDRHAIRLEQPIKELGVSDVRLVLHPEITQKIKVWIVEE